MRSGNQPELPLTPDKTGNWWKANPAIPPWHIGKPTRYFKRPESMSQEEYHLEILRRGGMIVEGDKRYRTPEQVALWFDLPRRSLGGRSWSEIHMPFSYQARLRFIAAMEEETPTA